LIAEARVNVGKRVKPSQYFPKKLKKAVETGDPQAGLAPRTLLGSVQPEKELWVSANKELIKKGFKDIKVGADPQGIPVAKRIARSSVEGWLSKGNVGIPLSVSGKDIKKWFKTKLAGKIESYTLQLKEADMIARDVARKGILKYKLLKQKNWMGEILDNAGLSHVQKIKLIGRGLAKKYGVPIRKEMLDAFAEVHDIDKEFVLNYATPKAISRGLKKGYYDELLEVKKLSKTQKAELGRMIELDERPPVNIQNLLGRGKERAIDTLKHSPFTLTKEEKLIINADRLARFGAKADPAMIYNLAAGQPGKISKLLDDLFDVNRAKGLQLKKAKALRRKVGKGDKAGVKARKLKKEYYAERAKDLKQESVFYETAYRAGILTRRTPVPLKEIEKTSDYRKNAKRENARRIIRPKPAKRTPTPYLRKSAPIKRPANKPRVPPRPTPKIRKYPGRPKTKRPTKYKPTQRKPKSTGRLIGRVIPVKPYRQQLLKQHRVIKKKQEEEKKRKLKKFLLQSIQPKYYYIPDFYAVWYGIKASPAQRKALSKPNRIFTDIGLRPIIPKKRATA
jgi:hypothetical protein